MRVSGLFELFFDDESEVLFVEATAVVYFHFTMDFVRDLDTFFLYFKELSHLENDVKIEKGSKIKWLDVFLKIGINIAERSYLKKFIKM